MSRTVHRGALVALLAIALSAWGALPVSAGDPIRCTSSSWTWTGAADSSWDNTANWACDSEGTGYPEFPGDIANFADAGADRSPIIVPSEGRPEIMLGELNFLGTQAFTLQGGPIVMLGGLHPLGVLQEEPTPLISNVTGQVQVLDLTVLTDFFGLEYAQFGEFPPLFIEGNASVSIDRLEGEFLEVHVGEGMSATVGVLDHYGLISKAGPGSLTVLDELNPNSGAPVFHVDSALAGEGVEGTNPGRLRVEAQGPAGPVFHANTTGQTEVAPAGDGQVGVIEPGICMECSPTLARFNQFLFPPVGGVLLGGSTFEVDVQPYGDEPSEGEFPFSADLLVGGGPVLLEVPTYEEEFLSFAQQGEEIPDLGVGTLEVSVQGALTTGDVYPIVISIPPPSSRFVGVTADPCSGYFEYGAFGICGEFAGYPDGHQFTADGYRFRIDYQTLPEVDEVQSPQSAWAQDIPPQSDAVVAITLEVLGRASTPPSTPPTTPPAEEPIEPVRLGGGERIETAVLGSQQAFEDDAADAVVLATATNPADAVAGTPFASAMGGPILLSATDELTPIVADEIQRILPAGQTVFVMGLDAAIDDSVLAEIQELGYAVERVGGANRFGTAVEVADRLLAGGFAQTDGRVLLADGHGFEAATIAGPAAAATQGVVLLSAAGDMAPETAAWLTAHPSVNTTAIGAEAAAALPKAEAIVADTAPALSVAVAEAFFDAPAVVGVATYSAFPDPLTGGTHVALRGGPLLLSDTDALPGVVADYVTSIAGGLGEVFVYGGTAALSDTVVADLTAASAG